MTPIERKLLECFVAQVNFERYGILQILWDKKLEVEELLEKESKQETYCDMSKEEMVCKCGFKTKTIGEMLEHFEKEGNNCRKFRKFVNLKDSEEKK